QDERSQLRNRELATDRIVEQLREATKVRRPRRPTRPTKASAERRLDEKKRRGQNKPLRRSTHEQSRERTPRIDHVRLPVGDIDVSRAFYVAALAPLGYR